MLRGRDSFISLKAAMPGAIAMAFWWPIVFQADFYTGDRSSLGGSDPALIVLSLVFPIAILFASPIIERSCGRHRRLPPLGLLAVGAMGCAGYLLQALAGMSSVRVASGLPSLGTFSEIAGVLGSCLSALCLVVFLVEWIGTQTAREEGPLLAEVSLSYAIAELFQVILFFLPPEAQFGFRLACPMLAMLFVVPSCASSRTSPALREKPLGGGSLNRRALILLLVLCAVFTVFDDAFSYALTTRAGMGIWYRTPVVPIASMVLMLLATPLLLFAPEGRLGVLLLFVCICVFYMACLTCVVVLPRGSVYLAGELMVSTGHCFRVFVLIVVCLGCACGEPLMSRYPVSVFVTAAMAVPILLNIGVGLSGLRYAATSVSFAQIASVGLFVVSVLVIFAVFLDFKHAGGNRSRKTQEEWLEKRCADATESAKLTPKESQVLVLMYRGFTVSRVAEEMGVRTSTVDTHVKHIYRKLGIHSRQELIDIIDNH